MNTGSLVIETLGGSNQVAPENEAQISCSTRPQSMTLHEYQERGISPATHRRAAPRHNVSRRILRRLKGFLVEQQGLDCKVAFIVDSKPIFYYLPFNGLQQVGVTAENQPFEMDEFESKNDDGSFSTGYTFRPLAAQNDAFSEPLDQDEIRKQKRSLILKKFGKAKI